MDASLLRPNGEDQTDDDMTATARNAKSGDEAEESKEL
jgi:hypothetical protein